MRSVDKVQRFCVRGLCHGAKETVVDCYVVAAQQLYCNASDFLLQKTGAYCLVFVF